MAGRKSFHASSAPTSAGNPECPGHLVLRLACHVLADQIPDEGLPEFCETANELFEFYTQRALKKASPLLVGGRTPVVGNVVRTFERPVFSIEEG
jgi:hypothetical protein